MFVELYFKVLQQCVHNLLCGIRQVLVDLTWKQMGNHIFFHKHVLYCTVLYCTVLYCTCTVHILYMLTAPKTQFISMCKTKLYFVPLYRVATCSRFTHSNMLFLLSIFFHCGPMDNILTGEVLLSRHLPL